MKQTLSSVRILCLRHGETNYTDVFPDLTPIGESRVREVATDLAESWVKKHKIQPSQLAILSSPKTRAHGTAAIIAQTLGHHADMIIIRKELDAMKWLDPARALSACKGLHGKGYINYETEQVFADPAIFESQDQIRGRWYAFLSEYISAALAQNAAQYTIMVSHYELFCNITKDIFGIVASESSALKNVEPIHLTALAVGSKDEVILYGAFRGEMCFSEFNLNSHVLTPA